jgi:SAM-dependent methyltransferase
MQPEFEAVFKWCRGFGIDLGCGGNRLSPDTLAVDKGAHDRPPNGPDLIGDVTNLGLGGIGFHDECFDFIFSSHCLEDFDDIGAVLLEWWRKIKPGGYLVLLLPDMEGGRYAKVGDPDGNPSHKTNVGVNYMKALFEERLPGKYEIVQCDTLKEGSTFDFVTRKKGVAIA